MHCSWSMNTPGSVAAGSSAVRPAPALEEPGLKKPGGLPPLKEVASQPAKDPVSTPAPSAVGNVGGTAPPPEIPDPAASAAAPAPTTSSATPRSLTARCPIPAPADQHTISRRTAPAAAEATDRRSTCGARALRSARTTASRRAAPAAAEPRGRRSTCGARTPRSARAPAVDADEGICRGTACPRTPPQGPWLPSPLGLGPSSPAVVR